MNVSIAMASEGTAGRAPTEGDMANEAERGRARNATETRERGARCVPLASGFNNPSSL
jgi:hypothetical protein